MAINNINPAAAAGAYANTMKTGGAGLSVPGEAQKTSFGDVLKDVAVEGIETIRDSEKMSAKAVIGKADLTEVVAAVTEAETLLQTAVAVRDRMLNAYQEIMRMPI